METKKAAPKAAETIVTVAARSLEDDLAEDVRIIPLAGKADYAEHLIVASATSARRVTSMAEHLVEKFKAAGLRPHVEGLAHSSWVLIDAGALVVHLFKPEARSYYNLEKLWEAEFPQAAAGSAALV